MEELKPILIKPMVKKYYDKLKTNEQRLEFWENLVFRGMDGQEPQIEDEMVELALMPCLDSIRECRDNYNRRQAKNAEYGILGKEYGIQGKEYGIQGKEFGKLGGRPRKGETKEQYAERKKEEKAEWEKQQELYKMITAEQGLFDFIKVVSQNQLQELASAYILKGYTKTQISKVFEYIRSKNE